MKQHLFKNSSDASNYFDNLNESDLKYFNNVRNYILKAKLDAPINIDSICSNDNKIKFLKCLSIICIFETHIKIIFSEDYEQFKIVQI